MNGAKGQNSSLHHQSSTIDDDSFLQDDLPNLADRIYLEGKHAKKVEQTRDDLSK